jgi:hypothetical protein
MGSFYLIYCDELVSQVQADSGSSWLDELGKKSTGSESVLWSWSLQHTLIAHTHFFALAKPSRGNDLPCLPKPAPCTHCSVTVRVHIACWVGAGCLRQCQCWRRPCANQAARRSNSQYHLARVGAGIDRGRPSARAVQRQQSSNSPGLS